MTSPTTPQREAGRPGRPRRWLTDAGYPTPELVELIRRARTGERWVDIAATFYPRSGNGIRKACDVFGSYASDEAKDERRAALARRAVGPRNPRVPVEEVIGPPLVRERRDLWAGMGACFANPARPAA